MFRIEYEYYDKRGHIRSKKIECGDITRVKFHCNNIMNLTEHQPMRTPRITQIMGDMPDKIINFKEMIDKE